MNKNQSLSMGIIHAAPRTTVNDASIFEFLECQPDIAWMMAPNASAIHYNKMFYDYTGKTPEYMKDWAWQDFLPVEEIPRVAGSLYRALDTGEPWECLYPLRSRDGDYRQFLVKAAPVHDRTGKITFWMGSAMDVSGYLFAHRAAQEKKRA